MFGPSAEHLLGAETTYCLTHERKAMKRIVVCVLFVIGMSVGMIGCSEKTKVEEKKTTTTPSGTTTETETKEIKKSGDNPPPNP
jgi:hypothetical protein